MALGVVEGIKELGLVPGQDIVTGGFDWSEKGVEAVVKGEIEVTMGGHYMEGAWVAVLIYDYFNGVDFKDESLRMKSNMGALTKENIDDYLQKLKDHSQEYVLDPLHPYQTTMKKDLETLVLLYFDL